MFTSRHFQRHYQNCESASTPQSGTSHKPCLRWFGGNGSIAWTSAVSHVGRTSIALNPLTPNDPYMGRTAPPTSKRCILYIYSTNAGTEYFKHALYSPFFFSSKGSLFHNANLFGSCIIHILYIGCAEI